MAQSCPIRDQRYGSRMWNERWSQPLERNKWIKEIYHRSKTTAAAAYPAKLGFIIATKAQQLIFEYEFSLLLHAGSDAYSNSVLFL
jgi:hypothetical protein